MRPSAAAGSGSVAGDEEVLSRGKKKLILAAVTFLATLLFSEVALRIFWHNPYRNQQADRVLTVPIHHPNADYRINRNLLNPDTPLVRFRTDADSFIIPSRQYEKPDFTIAFLGGSTTECNAVREDLRFPALVSTLLGEQGLKVNTLNAGRSGNTAHDSLLAFLLHVASRKPDMAVLFNATNDIGILRRDGDYWKRAGRPVGLADQGKWILQDLSTAFAIAALVRYVATSRLSQRTGDPAGMGARNDPNAPRLDARPFRARVAAFVHVCRDFGVTPVLMTQPLSSSRNVLTPDWADMGAQDRFNALIRDVARQEEAQLIDLATHIQNQPDWNAPVNIFYDGMHVTDRGSRLYAEYIVETLQPEIRRMLVSRTSGSGSRSE